MTYTKQQLEANGGHSPECEGSCHESCPIGRERRAEANQRAAEAQALSTANGRKAEAATAAAVLAGELPDDACDECHHVAAPHLWAPAFEATKQPEVAEFIYTHATCWAENVCGACDPALHAQVLELAGQA